MKYSHPNLHDLTLFCSIVGETLFNANYPAEPPDFIFTGNDQQFQPNIAEVKVLSAICLSL